MWEVIEQNRKTEKQKGMVIIVTERLQILYMQARIMRMACEDWNKPMEVIAELFVKYHVLHYIEECFGIFHLEGDEAVLEDVAAYIKNKRSMINDTAIKE